jgi:hypothetical protein
MRRVWTAVSAVWVLLALVAVLAWARPAPVTSAAPQQTVVAVKGKDGATKYVVATASTGAVHTTTHTSGVALP